MRRRGASRSRAQIPIQTVDLHDLDEIDPGGAPQGGATQLGTVDFDVEWRRAFDEPISRGLAGRVIRKLSTLTPETLITPNEHFFVRTARPGMLGSTADWKIAVSGRVAAPGTLELDALLPLVEPQGVHLLECSGNPRRRSFGLMSACEWSGIPAVDVLERTRPAAPGSYETRLRVPDAGVVTRRLDRGYYARTVTITET